MDSFPCGIRSRRERCDGEAQGRLQGGGSNGLLTHSAISLANCTGQRQTVASGIMSLCWIPPITRSVCTATPIRTMTVTRDQIFEGTTIHTTLANCTYYPDAARCCALQLRRAKVCHAGHKPAGEAHRQQGAAPCKGHHAHTKQVKHWQPTTTDPNILTCLIAPSQGCVRKFSICVD